MLGLRGFVTPHRDARMRGPKLLLKNGHALETLPSPSSSHRRCVLLSPGRDGGAANTQDILLLCVLVNFVHTPAGCRSAINPKPKPRCPRTRWRWRARQRTRRGRARSATSSETLLSWSWTSTTVSPSSPRLPDTCVFLLRTYHHFAAWCFA